MPRKKQCSFCGERFEPGKGTTFVRNDASVFEFCSSKCRKNFNLGRNPIRVRWTQKFRAFREETLGIHAKKVGAKPKAAKDTKSKEAEKPKKEAKKPVKGKSGKKIKAEKRLERKAKRAAKKGRKPPKKAANKPKKEAKN